MIHAHETAVALIQVGRDIERYARAAIREAGERAEHLAKTTTRFEDVTGALRRSIGFRMSGDYSGQFFASAPHALFVEAGTRPHVIEARNAPMLRFQIGGRWISARSVRHPGTRARDFMRDAAEQSNAGELVEYAVTTAIQGR